MRIGLLSIIMPTYNECDTIEEIVEIISNVKLLNGIQKELIIIDDFSTDGTREKLKGLLLKYANKLIINVIYHEKNKGKGSAIHTGIHASKGEVIIIQDSDMEYNPNEYNDLLKPMIERGADVVYGSRFMGGKPHRILFFWHSIGNKFLTFLSNAFTNLNLTDMETCYKMFRTEIIKGISLVENRFGFEPEITAKISRVPSIKIFEVGISYYGRSYNEGKKINWIDGVRAIYCILKYGLFKF